MTPPTVHQDGSGVLTEDQRQFLDGRRTIDNSSTRSSTRSEVRTRLRNAVLDFATINEHLEQDQLAMALTSEEEALDRVEDVREGESVDAGGNRTTMVPDEQRERIRELMGFDDLEWGYVPPEIVEARPELVVFLYRITGDIHSLESVIETGIKEVYSRYQPDSLLEDVDISIDAKLKENLVATGKNKMPREEPLSPPEVQALLESEEFDDERIGEYVREHPATSG